MNEIRTNGGARHESYFLTELLGGRAYLQGKSLGKVKDVVAVDRGRLAEVTHVRIARPFGGGSLLVPIDKVRLWSPREIILDGNGEDAERYARPLLPDEVLLKDYVLDKKVLDVEEREVEVVYDMRLVRRGEKYYVSDVDISRYGLLRQLGLKGLAAYFYRRAGQSTQRLIPWSYVEPLPAQLDTLQGNVKLNILKEKLADIHPADLADMLEELDSQQRVTLLERLDTEHASDTLEEIDPAVQRDIVFSLRKERVAQLIGEMTPGQAADIVSVLPAEEKRTILRLLEPEQVNKIEEIIAKQDVKILDFTTANFFKCSGEMTAAPARAKFREAGPFMDVLAYFYVVNETDGLLGVTGIEQVFMAADEVALKDLMVENVISLRPDSTMKQAADMFLRYGFRALPVTDENEVILGVVPYRDVMHLKHRILE